MKWVRQFLIAFLGQRILETSVRCENPAPSFEHHEHTRPTSERPDSLLLLCTADGSIFVVDAWTGKLQSKSRTGMPLLTRSVAEQMTAQGGRDNPSTDDEDSVILANHIVPGLDGKLYWQDNDVDGSKDEDVPLQPLPLSIPSLLAHPVRTCSENQKACGILHAVEHTVLYGLDPQNGSLQWSTRSVFGVSEEDAGASDFSYLILQRKDVSIQQVSSRTGRQLWNISMGSYQAVDFKGIEQSAHKGPSSLLDDDDIIDNNEDPNAAVVSLLPSLAFLDEGRTLVAVSQDKDGLSESYGPILWRIEAPSRIASIFGVLERQWHPINILEAFYEQHEVPKHQNQLLLADAPFSGTQSEWLDNWMKDEMFRLHQLHFGNNNNDLFFPNSLRLLPAPEDMIKPQQQIDPIAYTFELPTIPITVVEPNGLVLSWEFVNTVCLAVVTLSFFSVFIFRRQKQLLRRAQIRVNIAEAARRNPPVESQSMPGETRKAPVSKEIHSDPGELLAVENAAAAALTKTSGSTASDEVIQQGVTQQGGIPLVRYARYQSEFQEIQALGKGGFGSVFRCRNNLDGSEYAIKKVSIRRKREDDASFNQRLQRVLREVKILAVLDHPNIVRYYTAWLEVENCHEDETEQHDDGGSHFSSSYLTNNTTTDRGRSRTKNALVREKWYDFNDGSNSQSSDIFLPRVGRHGSPLSGEDLGFIFEGSDEYDHGEAGRGLTESKISSGKQVQTSEEARSTTAPPKTSGPVLADDTEINQRHTLYIQMQLCSFDDLSDFLANPEARKGSLSKGIDISLALRYFLQIVSAVQYVHEKGLIHRDLKPTNCFVDETGMIKVGDFGLSRESGDTESAGVIENPTPSRGLRGDDQTAGVGTRLYASPEQSAGSSYDSKTE